MFSISIPEGAIERGQQHKHQTIAQKFQYPRVQLRVTRRIASGASTAFQYPRVQLRDFDDTRTARNDIISIPEGAIESSRAVISENAKIDFNTRGCN